MMKTVPHLLCVLVAVLPCAAVHARSHTPLAGPSPFRPPKPLSVAQQTDAALQETVFWQSIMNSTNPADFEAYLAQFPDGAFRPLAVLRLAALRSPENPDRSAAAAPKDRLFYRRCPTPADLPSAAPATIPTRVRLFFVGGR